MCTQVQDGQFAVRFRFDGKLDVVNAVDVPGEPFHVILMDSNIRIINITQSMVGEARWITPAVRSVPCTD